MNKRILIILIILLGIMALIPGKQTDIPEGKQKIRTIESRLSPQTKKLIKRIRSTTAPEKSFRGYDARVYRELTRYLNSEWHIKYDGCIIVTDVKAVQRRIISVRKVNKILYRRTKKLYRGKNMKTLEAFEQYIEDKITYHLPNPDMYISMRYGTCVSYATMLKAMCDMSGIPCRIYAGWATPWDGHCWNRVRIKKRWYWVDLTWDDNTIYGDSSYLHQRSLWDDHQDYKPIRIYRPSLPY